MEPGISVLVVDDDALNRKLLRANFEHERMGVIEAWDGREALQFMEDRPVDIIVSDLHMPYVDGYQLCREWRQRDPDRRIPIVLFSATETSPRSRVLGLEAGADAYVVKPTPFGNLLEIIHGLLKARRSDGRAL